MQTGLWRVQGLVIPKQMRLPDRSPSATNKTMLAAHWPEGIYVTDLPEGITLKLTEAKYMDRGHYQRIMGAPPTLDSFFFDEAPNRTFYMQGKARFAYSMHHGFDKQRGCVSRYIFCWPFVDVGFFMRTCRPVRSRVPRSEISLDWIRRADVPGVKTFQVSAVMPAEAPGLNGIGKFQYHSGIYCEEAGVKKVLFLELRDFPVNMHVRGARKSPNVLHLFAMEIVPEEMGRSLVTRAPAGQNSEPRRGRAGWVVHGDPSISVRKAGRPNMDP